MGLSTRYLTVTPLLAVAGGALGAILALAGYLVVRRAVAQLSVRYHMPWALAGLVGGVLLLAGAAVAFAFTFAAGPAASATLEMHA